MMMNICVPHEGIIIFGHSCTYPFFTDETISWNWLPSLHLQIDSFISSHFEEDIIYLFVKISMLVLKESFYACLLTYLLTYLLT